jgi:hypothetical protein
LTKVAVQCSADSFVVNQSLVLRINICGENRHLCQARNRYNQSDTRETLEIKEDGSFIHNIPTVGFDVGTQVKGGVAKGKFSFSEIKKTKKVFVLEVMSLDFLFIKLTKS